MNPWAMLLCAAIACQSAPQPAASPAPTDANGAAPAATAPAADATACLDRELAKRGLNQYGDAPHTMYPGGTPLFNEGTGKRIDRAEYLRQKHPDIAAACASP